jgi:hypothetical protein
MFILSVLTSALCLVSEIFKYEYFQSFKASFSVSEPSLS